MRICLPLITTMSPRTVISSEFHSPAGFVALASGGVSVNSEPVEYWSTAPPASLARWILSAPLLRFLPEPS